MAGCDIIVYTETGKSANVNNSGGNRTFITYRRAPQRMAHSSLAVTEICVIIASKVLKWIHCSWHCWITYIINAKVKYKPEIPGNLSLCVLLLDWHLRFDLINFIQMIKLYKDSCNYLVWNFWHTSHNRSERHLCKATVHVHHQYGIFSGWISDISQAGEELSAQRETSVNDITGADPGKNLTGLLESERWIYGSPEANVF